MKKKNLKPKKERKRFKLSESQKEFLLGALIMFTPCVLMIIIVLLPAEYRDMFFEYL